MNNFFSLFDKVKEVERPATKSIARQTAKAAFDDILKIVVILDESLSMEPVRDDMIKSINQFIEEQKSIEGQIATFTLIKFNHNVTRLIVNKPMQQVELLTLGSYRPNGSTALYDAIGTTIDYFSNEKNVLMVIVTDGQENQSTKYSRTQIARMIENSKKNSQFTYVYLSCNLETLLQGQNIGMDNSAFSSNQKISQDKFGTYFANDLNVAITNYRQNGISVQAQLNSNNDILPHRKVIGRVVYEQTPQKRFWL